jgi:REP element-mobilizing transposase RayT
MKQYQSLSHTRWDCKYHVVFIPKRRKKKVFDVRRRCSECCESTLGRFSEIWRSTRNRR